MQQLLLFLFCFFPFALQAQNYDIVIRGGHVIDPRNGINETMDVAISGDTIALIEKSINAEGAKQVVNARGLYVMPGLIDIHGHHFYGTEPDHAYSNGFSAIAPAPNPTTPTATASVPLLRTASPSVRG